MKSNEMLFAAITVLDAGMAVWFWFAFGPFYAVVFAVLGVASAYRWYLAHKQGR